MSGKIIYGVGVYKKGKFKSWENGKITKEYNSWRSMMERCYDPAAHEIRPTYIGCSVCPDWLCFQAFAEWYHANYPQDGESYQLDKNLKVIGNKVYSPDTCLFTSDGVSNFISDNGSIRGRHMIGVYWDGSRDKYMASCCNPFTKKQEKLGRFACELEAHLAWRKRKSELAYELAMTQTNPEVRDALLRWKDALDNNEIHTV